MDLTSGTANIAFHLIRFESFELLSYLNLLVYNIILKSCVIMKQTQFKSKFVHQWFDIYVEIVGDHFQQLL